MGPRVCEVVLMIDGATFANASNWTGEITVASDGEVNPAKSLNSQGTKS